MPMRLALALVSSLIAAPTDDPAARPDRPANRLAGETSPYLLQHAHNPVDWYPWGPEAFERAKAEGKPVFLSIGYATCHWCHVMERESFENEAIAKALNEHFVCIKVDREERPDVDAIYMAAVQAFQGSGGWPMSVFLFPDGRPFFAGTYFPPGPRDGIEGFPKLLDRVREAWRDHRDALERDADKVAALIRRKTAATEAAGRVPLSRAMADAGLDALREQFDPEHAGFGFDPDQPTRPKFPEPANLLFLLDLHARRPGRDGLIARGGPEAALSPLAMVERTLDRMARGGIRDHLGGGYHRYSTDRTWSVPHFEKMLYDQALITAAHLAAFEATGDARWRREAEDTLAFVARELTIPEGGFASALDADSEGEEGTFYVWDAGRVDDLLGGGPEAKLFGVAYGLTRAPNFEGDRHVLLMPRPPADLAANLDITSEALDDRLAPMRQALFKARSERPRPALDDKVLPAWNGLMIAAYADAYRVLKKDEYRDAAEKAADFVLAKLRDPDGRLLRSYRAGQAKGPAFLDDYAATIHGLLRLHAATGEARRLDAARALADRMIDGFADPDGGFYLTPDGHESLIARPKDPFDGALPSGNALAVADLIALAELTGEARYLDVAGKALESFSAAMARVPAAVPTLLVALHDYLDARPEAAADGPATVPADDPLGIPRQVVKAAARLADAARPAPGAEFVTELVVEIAEGWHIYANPVGLERLKPTVVELAANPAVELVSVDYPEGERKVLGGSDEPAAVYEGRATIRARLRASADAETGAVGLTFRLKSQACDDRACLAPTTLDVPLRVEILPSTDKPETP